MGVDAERELRHATLSLGVAAREAGVTFPEGQEVLARIFSIEQTMRELVHGLLKIRVRPYYLYHCDNVAGVGHLATSVEKGREIMRGLIGYTTGFAVPQYIIATRLGKIPLWEEVAHRIDDGYQLENYKGETMDVGEHGL